MAAVGRDTGTSVRFVIPGRPVPAARPRVTKNGTYYDKRYRVWLDAAKVYARQAWLGKEPIERPYPVKVEVFFFGARPNADIDNLVKGVMDALTGVMFEDDCQVAVLHVVRSEGGRPETSVEVEPRYAESVRSL